MRFCVCPWRVLNNLHSGKIFYDSAYNLLIGSKPTFTVDIFEPMQLINLSLYYVTRIKPAQEKKVCKNWFLFGSQYFILQKQPINNRSQLLIFHFNYYISRGNSFNLKGHAKEALGFCEGGLPGGSISDQTRSRRDAAVIGLEAQESVIWLECSFFSNGLSQVLPQARSV